MDISITASKGYCYAWCNTYELETEYTTAIDNNMICNGSAFGDISFSLDCNMTMPKAICNCSANNATIDLDNLKFPKYTFTTTTRDLMFEG
jgi:hypothetical protein